MTEDAPTWRPPRNTDTVAAPASEKPARTLKADPSSTVEAPHGNAFVAGLIGIGIAVGCVLPPLVHLVTGPFGPFLGGFVAGNYAKPRPAGQALISTMIGIGLAAIIGTAAEVLLHVVDASELPSWFPSNATLVGIVFGVWLYGTVVSGVGVAVAAAFARRKSDAPVG